MKPYRPSEYGRCTLCRKLIAKDNLRPGPDGGMLGPECMKNALKDYGKPVGEA